MKLQVLTYDGTEAVELPAATTAGYAALHVAEALGLDPEALRYFLVDAKTHELIDEGEVVAGLDGQPVLLMAATL